MGFRFRKSISSGPFRINFSNSGISSSVGFKGARLNFSSRGTYVTFGSNGIYYRRKISGPSPSSSNRSSESFPTISLDEQHTITSGNIDEITDIDSQEFINELKEKEAKISYYNCFGIIPLLITAVVLYFTFFTSSQQTTLEEVNETSIYIRPLQSSNSNIRDKPDKTSLVIGSIKSGQQYKLLDESQPDWYKIQFHGYEGYVSKKYSEKTEVTTTNKIPKTITSPSLYEKQSGLFWFIFSFLTIAFIILLNFLKKIDRKRLLVEIYYDIDDSVKEVYDKFVYHFSALLNCSKVWQYLHTELTNDYKYSSGAGVTVTRKPLTKIYTNKSPSKIFKTNVQIPHLGLINTDLYFFPERLIIKRGSEFGAIMYKNVECDGNTTRFIESESVPNDSIIVGHTWRYLNKNGTPDRRFKDNRQIPICQYSEYSFNSNSGLNEKIVTSKRGVFDDFLYYIEAIGQLQRKINVGTNLKQGTNFD